MTSYAYSIPAPNMATFESPCPDWHESDDHTVWPFCSTCSSCGLEPTSRLQLRVEVLRIFKVALYVPLASRTTAGVTWSSASLQVSVAGSAGPAGGAAATVLALPEGEGSPDVGAAVCGRSSDWLGVGGDVAGGWVGEPCPGPPVPLGSP